MVSLADIKKGLYRFQETDQGWVVSIRNARDLLKAAERARDSKKISNFDCFSPFPIHGLEKAMGLSRSWVPFVTLIFGLLGCFAIFAFMTYVDVISWPMNIGGKPNFAWPAYIPITFEIMVLSAGLASVAAVIYLGRLGKGSRSAPTKAVTSTGFAIWIADKLPESEIKLIMGDDLVASIAPVKK